MIAVDIFRERVLLKAVDGTTRTVMLADLRAETQGALPTPEPETPRAPSALATFDEGDTAITTEKAVDAVTPRPKNRRRRRGRRRGRHGGGGGGGTPPSGETPGGQ